MSKQLLAGVLSLLIGLNCFTVHGQTVEVTETQPFVRLKSTFDVSGVSVLHSQSLDLDLLLTSASSFLNPISKLVLLENKTSQQLIDISSGQLKRVFEGFQGLPILSPNGRRLLTIDRKSVSVWSVETGEKLCDLKIPKKPQEARWSPDESSIMLFEHDNGFKAQLLDKQKTVVHVYDAETGRLRFTLKVRSVNAHATFSPTSQLILTASNKEDAKLWDALTGKQKAKLSHDQTPYYEGASARFSPDGRFVLVSSSSFGYGLWDSSSGSLYAELTKTCARNCTVLGFSPDGKLIVLQREHWKGFATIYCWIELRDTETNEVKGVLKSGDMRDDVDQLAWSADGKTLVTADGDKEYNGRIWEVETGKLIVTFPLIRKYSRIPFDYGYSDRDSISAHPTLPILLIVNNNFVRLLNSVTGEQLQRLDNATHPVKWTEDGYLLITRTKDQNTIKIWELVGSNQLSTLRVKGP